MYLSPYSAETQLAMDTIEIFPDPPLPVYLLIPANAESFLPERRLSVTGLLQFRFPDPFWMLHNDTRLSAIWSDLPPSGGVQPELLLSCMVPQRETLKQLLADVRRISPAPRSFHRAAVSSSDVLPDRLPIWVLSFWDCLSKAYGTCLSWRKSLDWAKAPCSRHSPNRGRIIKELDSLVHRVHSLGYLDGKRRDRHVEDVFDLLSNRELNSGQINDLLELLERRLADVPNNRFHIAPTELSTLLLYSHTNHTAHTYRKQYNQRSVEEVVQRRRSAVASVAWVPVGSSGHWISYIIDPITSTIVHGNSLGRQLPMELRDAFQWWMCNLRNGLGEPAATPVFMQISVTGQRDGFSCGILATNSLFHHLLPFEFPLVLGDATSIKTYRIERTTEILKLGIESVSSFLNCHFCVLTTLMMWQVKDQSGQRIAVVVPP